MRPGFDPDMGGGAWDRLFFWGRVRAGLEIVPVLLRGKQDEKSASIRMRKYRRMRDEGGCSPTGVANLLTGGAPQGAAFSGGRGRSIGSGFFTPMRNHSLPGRHITDCQMRLYMSYRHADTPTIAAA